MLLIIMETLINISIQLHPAKMMQTSSALAALAYIVKNLPKFVMFDKECGFHCCCHRQ